MIKIYYTVVITTLLLLSIFLTTQLPDSWIGLTISLVYSLVLFLIIYLQKDHV